MYYLFNIYKFLASIVTFICDTCHSFSKIAIRKSDKEVAIALTELLTVYNQGPNFINQLNIQAFEKYLKDSNDEKINIKFIKDGFPLFLSDRNPKKLSKKISNWAKDKNDILKIIKQFTKECRNGAIIPSQNEANYNINVFTVPKKDSITGQYPH